MTKNDTDDRLAVAVREARLARGWGKEEAARRAGVSSATWKRVEDGLSVQDHKLNAIAGALGWDAGRAFLLKAGGEEADLRTAIADSSTAHTDDRLDKALAAAEHLVQELAALKKERT